MEGGLILLNKESGVTSFDALRDIKRALGTGKVGHTGTLDKFAHGLLIVLAGNALRLSKWFTSCDKMYEGRIHFGIETDTLDPEGSVIAEAKIPSREEIEQVLKQFTGEILQAPPLYSAIHINGKRASELARSGKTVEMKKRPVTVKKLEILSWQPPFADIHVHCSSGTYIRSLARDIALAAGSRGHLNSLLRTQVGGFSHTEAQRHKEEQIKIHPIDKSIIATLGIPCYEATEQEKTHIIHGKPLNQIFPFPSSPSSPASPAPLRLRENSSQNSLAIYKAETLIAIIEKNEEKWKYAFVFNHKKL